MSLTKSNSKLSEYNSKVREYNAELSEYNAELSEFKREIPCIMIPIMMVQRPDWGRALLIAIIETYPPNGRTNPFEGETFR